MPCTTVVIPCFNHGRFVADAVRSCLAQVDADVRVVIVDDGSSDGSTPAACDACVAQSEHRVAVVHQVNRGLAAARNAGVEHARRLGGNWAGEYLTFLDADDWIEPTFVKKLHAAMLQGARSPRVVTRAGQVEPSELVGVHREGSASGGPADSKSQAVPLRQGGTLGEASDDHGWEPESGVSHAYCQERLVELHQMVWAVPEWDPLLMMVTNLHPVTTLIRRTCFEAVGGFDESMRDGYEDWDLWLKFVARGWSGVRVREPLFIWRRHSQNTMIVEAGKRHERLFARLVENHAQLYIAHAEALLVLSNRLLRQSEANWLDESGEAIVIRDTRRYVQTLITERDAARNEIAVQRRAMLLGDASSLEALAQERDALLAKVRELGAVVDGAAREQVSLLGTIGERTRERDESMAAQRRTLRSVEQLTRERDEIRDELEATRTEREALRGCLTSEHAELRASRAETEAVKGAMELERAAHAAALAATTAAYEAKPAVRLSRAVHRTIDRLPGFVSRPVRWLIRRLVR